MPTPVVLETNARLINKCSWNRKFMFCLLVRCQQGHQMVEVTSTKLSSAVYLIEIVSRVKGMQDALHKLLLQGLADLPSTELR